jgi:hypothetical protein
MTSAQREKEEAGDAMKALENRTLDSKREMDILAALDEMKALSSRHATVRIPDNITRIISPFTQLGLWAPSSGV